MASDDEHRESSAEQLKASLANEQVVVLAKATSEQGARSDRENPSGGSSDSKKKGLLLFDFACHSCSETMLIFSVF